MQDSEIKQAISQKLKFSFLADEIHAFGFWIIPHLAALPAEKRVLALIQIVEELETGKPIQYIFQSAFFGKSTYRVNKNTLIPRPETEELCQLILEHHPNSHLKGFEIGTGSGCIPIELLQQRSQWHFETIDINNDALKIAAENAKALGVSDRLKLTKQNALTLLQLPENIDLLISNPPYIPESAKKQMHSNVINYEPHTALFTPDSNPLIYYEKMAELVSSPAIVNLSIWLEINQQLAKETFKIFETLGNTRLLNDMSFNPRFIHCKIKR